MAGFYQGMVMGAIVLSAGIIGQIDSANERSVKQEMYTESVRHEPLPEQQPSLEGKTAMARLNERSDQFP